MYSRCLTMYFVVIALLLAGLLLAGCVRGTDEDQITTTPTPENGPALFAQHCAGCHGADGKGASGPSIKPPAFERQDLFLIVANGLPGTAMPAFRGQINEVEVEAIMDFLYAE